MQFSHRVPSRGSRRRGAVARPVAGPAAAVAVARRCGGGARVVAVARAVVAAHPLWLVAKTCPFTRWPRDCAAVSRLLRHTKRKARRSWQVRPWTAVHLARSRAALICFIPSTAPLICFIPSAAAALPSPRLWLPTHPSPAGTFFGPFPGPRPFASLPPPPSSPLRRPVHGQLH